MMLISKNIFKILKKKKIDFYTGVPDSVLKSFSTNLKNLNKKKHIIAANEGGAVSIATGYYLASKKIPIVYFQNSGLGNIINPITSIIHKDVYSIPMILFIGWRGAPGIEDEVQHKVQGKITLQQLKLLKIKYEIFNKNKYKEQLNSLISLTKKENHPVAFLFKNKDLETSTKRKADKNIKKYSVTRSIFISELLNQSKSSRIVATTGFTSRELFQIRSLGKNNKSKDFYMVGGMGHSSMVALGYSLGSKRQTICLDGDGAFLMHMGASVISSKFAEKNYKYILFNNSCHESVGGQPTAIDKIDLEKFCYSIGYKKYFLLKNKKLIKKTLKSFLDSSGPSFLNVIIDSGSLKNLIRIKNLNEIKKNFINL